MTRPDVDMIDAAARAVLAVFAARDPHRLDELVARANDLMMQATRQAGGVVVRGGHECVVRLVGSEVTEAVFERAIMLLANKVVPRIADDLGAKAAAVVDGELRAVLRAVLEQIAQLFPVGH
jgi:hypothetical protein